MFQQSWGADDVLQWGVETAQKVYAQVNPPEGYHYDPGTGGLVPDAYGGLSDTGVAVRASGTGTMIVLLVVLFLLLRK